ncbi:MAG: hypothetical protein LBH16_05655 [Treponema sp.]|jgi:hypothetical protein|nr:hypothetical protein [Treponema sp.]
MKNLESRSPFSVLRSPLVLANLILITVFALSFTACGGDEPCTHTWGAWAVTTAPTAAEEGVETSTCTKCGATKTQAVAALGCQCPAGTIHLAGEPDCGGEGCECEKNIAGVRVQGIAVTNREGVAAGDFNNMATTIGEVFDYIGINNPTQLTYIKANLKEVKVIANNGSAVTITGNIMTVRIGHTDGDIWAVIDVWVIVAMLHQLDTNTVYLADKLSNDNEYTS